MNTALVVSALLAMFATFTPDLCDDVYLDDTGAPYTDFNGRMLSRYCAWSGPDAPVWDDDVCCSVDEDGAACVRPQRNGRCRVGFKMYCEYGAEVGGGGVVCYEPFPSMCDRGGCVQTPEVPPPGQEFHLGCCSTGGVCQLVDHDSFFDCQGEYLACDFGIQNADGTIECFD